MVIPSGGGPHLDRLKEKMTTTHVIYGQNACPWVAHHFSCHVVLCPIDGAQITINNSLQQHGIASNSQQNQSLVKRYITKHNNLHYLKTLQLRAH